MCIYRYIYIYTYNTEVHGPLAYEGSMNPEDFLGSLAPKGEASHPPMFAACACSAKVAGGSLKSGARPVSFFQPKGSCMGS